MFHLYTLSHRLAWLGLLVAGNMLLGPFGARAQASTPIHLEAEDASSSGPRVVTTTPGYSGTGYLADFSSPTDSITFTVPIATSGRYDLLVRYTSPAGSRNTTVVVDGAAATKSLTAATGFASLTAGRYQLAAGSHKIKIGANQGNYGIDYIEVTQAVIPVTPLVNGRAEAENGVLAGTTVATSPSGFSGTGYVTGFTNSDANNVTLNLDVPTTGLYKLTIGYTSPYGLKGYNLQVNDEQNSGFFQGTTAGSDFSSVNAGNYLLYQGLNTITIGGNYGYYGVDYVQLAPVVVTPPAKPAKQLSDPLASASTESLFAYLVDLYGTKTLSGQQDDQMGTTNSEVSYVLATTGKEPAIASMDLYDYSTAPVAAYGTPSGTTERYLDWAKRGNGRGIASLIWHWRSPADITATAGGQVDPSGAFYTKNTTFNIATVLGDTVAQAMRYHLLLQDIDLIAAQLKKFQAAGVPVLWRPLHESPGNFFWWNAQGPAAFKQLWQLLYMRLTTRHQLHNLIWVYSTTESPSLDYYPGDAYVDVAGEDVYASATANMSNNWADMQTLFGGKKLITLSETGNPPDPDKIRAYGTQWSWFNSWQGSYVRSQPAAYLRRVYNDQVIITRDELADWYAYALPTRTATAASASLSAYPNPVSGASLTIKLTLPNAAAEADVTLLNSLGQRVAGLRTTLLAGANQLQLPLTGVAPGVYQLLVRTNSQPLLVQRVLVN